MRNSTVTEAPREGTRFRQPLRRSDPLLMKRWNCLWRDEFVEIRRQGREPAAGWVDDISPDGTVIWINLASGRGRIMIHVGDGFDIWRVETRILHFRSTANPAELTALNGQAPSDPK